MREFFKSWQRKTSGILLVLAVATTGCWLRSYVIWDEIDLASERAQYELSSFQGGLSWSREFPIHYYPGTGWSSTDSAR